MNGWIKRLFNSRSKSGTPDRDGVAKRSEVDEKAAEEWYEHKTALMEKFQLA